LAAAGHNDKHDNSEDDHGKAWQGTMKGSAATNTSGGHDDENNYRKVLGAQQRVIMLAYMALRGDDYSVKRRR